MATTTANPQKQVSLVWIALLRIMVGLLFLTTWLSNFLKGVYTADGLHEFFTMYVPQDENPLRWYAAFIKDVILPARHVFAPFQLVTEFLLGLFLLVGAFTRPVSLLAGFFLLNTFLATFGVDWPWSYASVIGILGVVFFTGAGRSLGVDAWLVRRYGEHRLRLW